MDTEQTEDGVETHEQNRAQEPGSGEKRRASGGSFFRGLGMLVLSILAVLTDMLVLGLVAACTFVAVTLTDLPRTDVLKEVRLQEPLRVFSADGSLMAEFGVQRRRPISFAEVPPTFINAFLATEDSRFFEHEGIDITGLGRAALSYAQTGRRSQGGSTITMQVARNFFLSREKTFQRKFAELLLSLHIERTLTKEEILELYLNKIFFGHRAYGISAAAELYYGKTLDQLTLAEMAMLAGLPKAPSANNPISNPKRALERRNYILGRMLELGYIDPEQFQSARAEPKSARLHRPEVDMQAGYVAEMVRREMVARFGKGAYQEGYRVTTTIDNRLQGIAQQAVRKSILDYDRRHGYRGPESHHQVKGVADSALDTLLKSAGELPGLAAGIVVRADAKEAEVYLRGGRRERLVLDQVKWAQPYKSEKWRGRAPRKVTDAVSVGDLIRLKEKADGTWELSQRPAVAGALVSIDPQNGAVKSLVGGYYFGASKFNRAVDALRQPGSSFKPIIYAAALDKGWTPASLIKDERISIRLNHREMWEPDNFDHKTMGPIRLRLALTKSRNLASINLLNKVGLDDAREFATKFGFDLQRRSLGLSMALGTAEVSLLQMAGAYSVFANGGFRIAPHYISRVENGAGEIVFESNAPGACTDCWFRYEDEQARTAALGQDAVEAIRVLDPRLVYQMTSIMQDVIKVGTGRRALKLEREDIGGKTGTTNDVRDSWFCGFQKDFVTIAWMGFDDFTPLGKGETGGRAGLGMWVDFMQGALEGKPQAILDVPTGMVEVRISKKRGTATSSTGEHTMAEWIREEYELMLMGPSPVKYVGKTTRRAPRASAPRVIDELF